MNIPYGESPRQSKFYGTLMRNMSDGTARDSGVPPCHQLEAKEKHLPKRVTPPDPPSILEDIVAAQKNLKAKWLSRVIRYSPPKFTRSFGCTEHSLQRWVLGHIPRFPKWAIALQTLLDVKIYKDSRRFFCYVWSLERLLARRDVAHISLLGC